MLHQNGFPPLFLGKGDFIIVNVLNDCNNKIPDMRFPIRPTAHIGEYQIFKQISDAYWSLAQGDPCDNKTWDYWDHVHAEEEYLASSRYEKDTNYWQKKHPDKPEPTTIKLCTAATTAITAKRITSTLGSELTERIGQFCKETSITPAVLFETAVILYLAKSTRKINL